MIHNDVKWNDPLATSDRRVGDSVGVAARSLASCKLTDLMPNLLYDIMDCSHE